MLSTNSRHIPIDSTELYNWDMIQLDTPPPPPSPIAHSPGTIQPSSIPSPSLPQQQLTHLIDHSLPCSQLTRRFSEGARFIYSHRSRSRHRNCTFPASGAAGAELGSRISTATTRVEPYPEEGYDEKKKADQGDGEGHREDRNRTDAPTTATGSGQRSDNDERTMGLVSAILMVMTRYD